MAVRLSALRAGRALPPKHFLVCSFVKDRVNPRAIVRLEGLGKLEKKLSLNGNEPATFRLVT
jgi:hypothetical protein